MMTEFGTQYVFDRHLLEHNRGSVAGIDIHRAADYLVNAFFRNVWQHRCWLLLACLVWQGHMLLNFDMLCLTHKISDVLNWRLDQGCGTL
jgi:hypothetical protein